MHLESSLEILKLIKTTLHCGCKIFIDNLMLRNEHRAIFSLQWQIRNPSDSFRMQYESLIQELQVPWNDLALSSTGFLDTRLRGLEAKRSGQWDYPGQLWYTKWTESPPCDPFCHKGDAEIKEQAEAYEANRSATRATKEERMTHGREQADLFVSFLFPRLDWKRLHFAFKLVHLHVQHVYRVLKAKEKDQTWTNGIVISRYLFENPLIITASVQLMVADTILRPPAPPVLPWTFILKLTVSHIPTSSFSLCAGSTFWARPSPSFEYAFVLVSLSTILNRSICCKLISTKKIQVK